MINLKKVRLSSGMNQKEFGKKFGVGIKTMNEYEVDKRMPNILFLIKIADEYNLTIDYLLDRPNKTN